MGQWSHYNHLELISKFQLEFCNGILSAINWLGNGPKLPKLLPIKCCTYLSLKKVTFTIFSLVSGTLKMMGKKKSLLNTNECMHVWVQSKYLPHRDLESVGIFQATKQIWTILRTWVCFFLELSVVFFLVLTYSFSEHSILIKEELLLQLSLMCLALKSPWLASGNLNLGRVSHHSLVRMSHGAYTIYANNTAYAENLLRYGISVHGRHWIPIWPSSNKTLSTQSMMSFPEITFHTCCHNSLLEKLSAFCVTPLRGLLEA